MAGSHTCLLIDGMSFLFRAFYATSWSGKLRQTSSGVYTNAVYGFTKMLLDYADLVRPTHLVVAWDMAAKENLVRTAMYNGYKANRAEPPAELVPQFDLVKEVTAAFGIPNVGLPGYEGDDVLGTLSARFSADGHQVVVVSGDYDTLQLVCEQVSVKILKNGGKHEHFTPDSLLALRGITADQVADIKGLQGDASDCIPGCPGIGEKTAVKLIRQYGCLDNLYRHVAELPPRLRGKLEEYRDQVYLSRQLATIFRDLPIALAADEAVWSYEPRRVLEKFTELEFGRTLLSRVG